MADSDPLIISLHFSDLNMQINRQRWSELIREIFNYIPSLSIHDIETERYIKIKNNDKNISHRNRNPSKTAFSTLLIGKQLAGKLSI